LPKPPKSQDEAAPHHSHLRAEINLALGGFETSIPDDKLILDRERQVFDYEHAADVLLLRMQRREKES